MKRKRSVTQGSVQRNRKRISTGNANTSSRNVQTTNLSNQQPNYRSDLVASVFKLKLKSITDDFFNKGVLGKVITHVHVIEFQK